MDYATADQLMIERNVLEVGWRYGPILAPRNFALGADNVTASGVFVTVV